jgi:hypothetical protein
LFACSLDFGTCFFPALSFAILSYFCLVSCLVLLHLSSHAHPAATAHFVWIATILSRSGSSSGWSLCPGLRLTPSQGLAGQVSHHKPRQVSHFSSPYNRQFAIRDAPSSGCQPRATDVALLLHLLQPFSSPAQTSQDTSLSPSRGRNSPCLPPAW